MVTTYFNPADIAYACNEIRAESTEDIEPILYISRRNARKLFDYAFSIIPNNHIDIDEIKDYGYIGKYKGCSVYITNTVGDLWVIVPKYKES